MSVYIFTKLFYLLLLLLLMCGTLCGEVCADSKTLSNNENAVEVFKKDQTISKVLKPNGGEDQGKVGPFTVDNIYFPILAATDDVLIAIAMVKNSGNTDILLKYIENKELSSNKNIASSKGLWTAQLAVQNEELQKAGDVMKGLLAVAKDNQIYLLLVTSGREMLPSTSSSSSELKFKFVVGTVKNGAPKKYFEWDRNKVSTVDGTDKIEKLFKEQQIINDNYIGGEAFLTHDNNIMFVLQMYISSKNNYALIHLSNEKAKVQFVFGKNWEDCDLHFFPWKKKIIMLSFSCNEKSKKKTMESNDMGASWEESEDALSRIYSFLQYKKDFATVTFDKKEVLLFTERKPNSIEHDTEDIYLWMSDGTRVGYVRTVVNNVDGAFYRSVLQTNNSLSALAIKYKTGKETHKIDEIFFTRQNEHLEKIKFLLNAWEKTDKSVSELCKDTEKQKSFCTTPPSIDGLVGFLHNTITVDKNAITWKDEYYYSNVTVENTKAENVTNGLKFNGAGKGAEWQVYKQNKKPYNYVDSGFTLVATVEIGSGIGGNHNSILGVYFTGLINRVSLWCTKNGNWELKYKKDREEKSLKLDNKCEEGKMYNVAYMLNKEKNLEIYVNAERLKNLNNEEITINGEEGITHFYFGADISPRHLPSTTESYMTITNVLLYNRPFKQEEIRELKPKEKNINDTRQTARKANTNHQSPHESTTQTDTSPQDTSTTKNKNENKSSTTEDSAARVGVVGVLCFMLFGVFTFLGRYVY